jgi:acyl-coenzyme A synthetase/AMP-(fatty) acid ligase
MTMGGSDTDAPLALSRHPPGAIVAVRGNTRIDVGRFRREVAALAALLPDKPYLVNLAQDRYRFMVGFAAALTRGQVTLMPSANTPGILRELAEDYPDLYALTDSAPPDLPHLPFPPVLPMAEEAPLLIPGKQPAVVLFTSGSTGRPKAVAKSWSTLMHSARAAGERLGIADFRAGCVVGTVPHQHSYGLESIILLAWQFGLAVSTFSPLFPADVIAALNAAPRPLLLVTTPVHLRALVADAGAMPRVDLILSATAPLPAALADAAEARFQAPLIEIYGCTEAGQIATRRSTRTTEWHCLDGVTLFSEGGSWWARGNAVEGTAPVEDVIEPTGSDTFRLGGRSADLVNIAGKRSSISYLTHQLLGIPGVMDGIFVMDEDSGQAVPRLRALAIAPGLSVEQIMQALRSRIDPAFLPRPLILVAALPRNDLGKFVRADLLRLAMEQAE